MTCIVKDSNYVEQSYMCYHVCLTVVSFLYKLSTYADQTIAHGGRAGARAGGSGRGDSCDFQVYPFVPRRVKVPRPTTGRVPDDRPYGECFVVVVFCETF